jgi:hypothetical protein
MAINYTKSSDIFTLHEAETAIGTFLESILNNDLSSYATIAMLSALGGEIIARYSEMLKNRKMEYPTTRQ